MDTCEQRQAHADSSLPVFSLSIQLIMTPTPTIHHSLLHGSGLNLYQANDLAGLGAFLFMALWLAAIAIYEKLFDRD